MDIFELENLEDVKKFENFLATTLKDRGLPPIVDGPLVGDLDLVDIFKRVQGREDKKVLFRLAEDIKINYYFCYIDWANAGIVNQQYFYQQNISEGSILDSQQNFTGKFIFHHHLTNYVFRYRALGDKIMGFIILFAKGKVQHDKFCGSRSRKKFFRRIAKDDVNMPNFFKQYPDLLENFDNDYRTSEAHGYSRLRGRSFAISNVGIEDPRMNLTNFWNLLRTGIWQLNQIITSIPMGQQAPKIDPRKSL